MRFGLSILQSGESLADIGPLARACEDAGFDLVGIPDSHSILREAYVAMAVATTATSRVGIGPMVTNPSTRHPTVTASAIATIDELSAGRAFLGIATGNSAVANVKLPRATLAGLEESILEMRAAFADRGAAAGRLSKLNWGEGEPPIYVAAAGPKAIAMAARCADAIVLDIGKDPHIVGKAIALGREEHANSDRAAEPLEFWLLGKGYIADSTEEARTAVATIMAATANDAFRVSLDWKEVPEDLKEPLREFAKRYVFSQHASTKSSYTDNVALLDELGLAEFIYDRFALIGSGEQIAEELRELERVGVDGVTFTGAIQDKPNFIRRMGAEIIPRLKPAA